MRFHSCARVILLLALALLLVSCDAFYSLVLENDTGEQLVVSVAGFRTSLPPCYVSELSIAGPAYGQPLTVKASDLAGEVYFSTELRIARPGQGVLVKIPPREVSTCPGPATSFGMRIHNDSDKPVELWWHGSCLGTIQAGGHEEFGPLVGTWQDVRAMAVRTAEGEETPAERYRQRLSYRLGEVPNVLLRIPK